eukprot:1232046-Heterocapsa_arctica.AAC.1
MDPQHRAGRDMSYGQDSYKHRDEHKQGTLIAQTREHSDNMLIGYIMFEEGGNKHSASRSQAGTQVAENNRKFVKGPILGNPNHRSDKLTWRPTNSMPGLIHMEDTSGVLRHRRTIKS